MKIKLPSKPKYKVIDEDLDFFGLFAKIEKDFENCFMLESLGEESYVSRYSVVGFDPESIISARGNILTTDGESEEVENPYHSLREIMPEPTISRFFAGGLIGFMSYEAANYFESKLELPEHGDFELFKFGVYKDGLIYDTVTGVLNYFYYDNDRSELIKGYVNKPDIDLTGSNTKVEALGHSMTQAQHAEVVNTTKDEIVAGNTFQCEVGFKTKFEVEGDALPIYAKLREVNPSPHMYYLKFGRQRIVGASPELLLRLRQGELESFPLAGTVGRGKDVDEDRKLARKLLNDPKEIAEHNMLVDLHRNDIGKVSRFGTVKVRSLMDIKKFSHVQHISSEIVGIIDNKYDMFDALAAVMPAGTLSGAPKLESMKIIQRNEKEPRGPYGGALGHFGFNGDCIFAIPIRTLFIADERAYAQTSGGIVYDSVPRNEYDEILRKLAAMQKVMDSFTSPISKGGERGV